MAEFSREQQTLCTFATKVTGKNCGESPLGEFREKTMEVMLSPKMVPRATSR